MKRMFATLMAIIMLCLGPCAYAQHYGWAFVIYDLGLSIEVDSSFTRTDDETLDQTNAFEQSGNVKPKLILEVYDSESQSQLFVYCAEESPYQNVDELTLAYAEDLGAVTGQTDEDGTTWQILYDQEFCGHACTRILSTFQNANAEYVLMLSDDGDAYILTMITFNSQAPDSTLDGITFTDYPTAAPTSTPTPTAGAAQ